MDWPYEIKPESQFWVEHPMVERSVRLILDGTMALLVYIKEELAGKEDSDLLGAETCFRAHLIVRQTLSNDLEGSHAYYVEQLKRVSYKEYLNSWHWRIVRRAALEKAKDRCQVCNTGPPETHIEVHHRTYIRRGQEEPEDVTVLCGKCHKRFHEDGKLAPEPKE